MRWLATCFLGFTGEHLAKPERALSRQGTHTYPTPLESQDATQPTLFLFLSFMQFLIDFRLVKVGLLVIA